MCREEDITRTTVREGEGGRKEGILGIKCDGRQR
jgi:hypothetical protein